MITNSEKVIEIEIELFGRVQGVNLRNMIRNYALGKNMRGYVLNKKDGSVFIAAQGNEKELGDFTIWLKSNPGISNVEKTLVKWHEPKARYSGFEVIRNDSFIIDKAKSILNLGRSLVIENSPKVPRHIVVIPDGNRRWAREKGLNASFGHYTSASDDRVMELFNESRRLGVKYFSIWGFSTENWKRDDSEIRAIFSLILNKIEVFLKHAREYRIRFRHFGRKDRLPKKLLKELQKLEEETKEYNEFNVNLMLDYGGRGEKVRAGNKMLRAGVKKIDEREFKKYLDSGDIPDPDLIIRTSGEKRTSGLMPYQSAYAEFYFTDVYFPEFDAAELRKAVKQFGQRVRRFGATAKSDLNKNG